MVTRQKAKVSYKKLKSLCTPFPFSVSEGEKKNKAVSGAGVRDYSQQFHAAQGGELAPHASNGQQAEVAPGTAQEPTPTVPEAEDTRTLHIQP